MKRKVRGISLFLGLFALAITPINTQTDSVLVEAVNARTKNYFNPLPPCNCTCEFNKTPIVTAGNTNAPGGGKRYSFTPSVKTTCGGTRCSIASITYSWTVTGTATFTIGGGITNAKKIDVDVTAAGDVTLSCTVEVTCSDGTKCSSTGSKTFRNLKP
jgi:hypothetical protein